MDPKKKLKQQKKTGSAVIKGKNSGILLFYAALVFAFTFILYGNTLHHSYALDDDLVSRSNTFVHGGFKGIPDIFTHGFLVGFNKSNDQSYRPVSLMTMAVEVGVWGENPATHHFFNVLYYAIACVLLFFVLLKIFPDIPPLYPLLMVLLFTAHPVHTEAVANFKSRDEVLNLLFLCGMLFFLFRYVGSQKWAHFVMAPVFFFLALLTKEQAITFVVLVPLFLWYFSRLPWKRILLLLLPFLFVIGIYLIIRASVLDVMTFSSKMTMENNALVAATNYSGRLATTVLILGKYLLLLFYPHPLSYDYSYNQIPIVSFMNPWVILTLLVFLAGGVYALLGFLKKDVYSFSFLFFIITISVVSNFFILIGSTLGERFLLIPSLAFCMGIVFLLIRLTRTDVRGSSVKKMVPLLSVIVIILALYSFKTITRNADWKNNLSLFESDVKSASNSTRTHASLGFEYFQLTKTSTDSGEWRSYYDKAKAEFTRSLEIYPRNNYALYNYGVLEYHAGNPREALPLYRMAVQVDSNDYNSWNDLSIITFQFRQYDSALLCFNRLLRFNPKDARIVDAIGVIYGRKNESGKAIEFYKQALAINPAMEATYDNLIQVYLHQDDTVNARIYSELKAKNCSPASR